MNEKKELKVMTDYFCHPLWIYDPEYSDISPHDSELGLSVELADELDQWAEWYMGILRLDDPTLIGFSSDEEERRFVDHGLDLAVRTQRELGDGWRVYYFDQFEGESSPVDNV